MDRDPEADPNASGPLVGDPTVQRGGAGGASAAGAPVDKTPDLRPLSVPATLRDTQRNMLIAVLAGAGVLMLAMSRRV